MSPKDQMFCHVLTLEGKAQYEYIINFILGFPEEPRRNIQALNLADKLALEYGRWEDNINGIGGY